MRIANSETKPRFSENSEGYFIEASFTFTGNAILYLKDIQTAINLKEWVWHIEFINGAKCYVITDKAVLKD